MAYEETEIDILNDDCLVNIFDYLSFEEKLKIELVSKRWQRLIELSWRNVGYLKICNSEFPNSNAAINVIKKCGTYIKYLDIYVDDHGENFSYVKVFKEILENCKSINQFDLRVDLFYKCFITTNLEKINLGLLFKNNPKMQSINLIQVNLNKSNEDSFLALNYDKITEISLDCCNFETNSYQHFLSNLKNLKKCYLAVDYFSYKSQANIAFNYLNALNSSNCQSLSEFTLFFFKSEPITEQEVQELCSLLQKQKKLSKLELKLDEDKIFLDCIDDRKSCYLNCFENLTALKIQVGELSDECIENLSKKCINLTFLEIVVDRKYSLTSVGEELFSKFEKLQTFLFYHSTGSFINLDKILKHFSQSIKLTKLFIYKFEIKNDTVTYLGSLFNLTYLRLDDCEITESELICLITTLPNLQKLVIRGCENITSYYNILEIVSNLKLNRKDKHTLELDVFSANARKRKISSEKFPMVRILYR